MCESTFNISYMRTLELKIQDNKPRIIILSNKIQIITVTQVVQSTYEPKFHL